MVTFSPQELIFTMPLTTQDNIMPNQIYVPLKVAAKKHNVKETMLTRLIAAGMIEAKEEAGETFVPMDKNSNESGAEPQTKEEIISSKFAHLRSQQISASEASRKYSDIYGVPIAQRAFSRWAKLGYITVLERGYRVQLDEAETAYCADVFAKKYREYNGRMQGVNVLMRMGIRTNSNIQM